MTLTTIILVPVLVASVVLLFSFVGCVPRVRFRQVGPHLNYRPGASGIQSVQFVISNTDSRRRDRIVVTRGPTIRRLMEPDPDPGPMFRYVPRFSQLGTGEAILTVGLQDLPSPTTGAFVFRCQAFTTPDATGTPLADTDRPPVANIPVTRRMVDGRPDPAPRPSFRLVPDFPALPGEPPLGATPEIRAGEPALPPPGGNTNLSLELNPALFGSSPPSVEFMITPSDGTPRTVTVAPGAPPRIPTALGSGSAEYVEDDVHTTFYLRLRPAAVESWAVTVSASGITSPRATVRVDPDPARSAAAEFRAHPWDGESETPRIGVEWTDDA